MKPEGTARVEWLRAVVAAELAEEEERRHRLSRVVRSLPQPEPRVLVYLALAGVIGAATFLRTWQINRFGFNSDEAVYAGQAAALANNAALKPFFPVFRAHPLLFQTLLSLSYRLGGGDVANRLIAAGFGLGTVVLVYLAGQLLYSRRAGLIAALFLAVMPYHVLVTRQVLLDGPLVFFTTLALYLVARFARTNDRFWLFAASGAMGLAILSKETAVLLVPSVYVFLALSPSIRVRTRDLAIALGILVLVASPYPIAIMLAGRSNTGHSYLTWQLFRSPNHSVLFYLETVPGAIGYLVCAAAAAGLWFHRRQASWREVLLASWVLIHVVFFELWPVKGFQYLLPIAPPIAILAGHAIASWKLEETLPRLNLAAWLPALTAGAIAVSLLIPAFSSIEAAPSGTFLAGTGGIPGGREAGDWIDGNVPSGATILTLGPSMANIVEFYGHRQAYGLSVSPNPLRRNPSYEALPNPDLALRTSRVQYIVWDSFSASRSSFFSEALMRYVRRYHGREVHTETISETAGGKTTRVPIIRIFEVRP